MTKKIKITSVLYPLFLLMVAVSLLSFTNLLEWLPLYALKYILLYTFIGFLLYAYKNTFKTIRISKVIILILLAVSMMLGFYNAETTSLLTSLMLMLNSLFLAFSALFLFQHIDKKMFIKLTKIMLGTLALIVLIPSLILSFDPSNYYLITGRTRLIGFFNNSNELARFSALGFILALRLFPTQKHFLKKLTLFSIMIISVYIVYLSDSRAALLLCAIIFTLFIIYWFYKKVGVKIFMVSTLFTSIIIVPSSRNLVNLVFNIQSLDDLSSGRIGIWSSLIESRTMLETLIGTGSGRSGLTADFVLANSYLEILMYFGLMGLTLWTLVLLFFLFKKIKFSKMLYGSIIIVGFLIYYVFEGGLISLGNIAGIYFWLELTQRKI